MSTKKKSKFHPDIKQIENDLINSLVDSPIFSNQDIITSTVICYFFTRTHLTQENLRNLTGFSAGKISQVINKLLNRGTITISHKSKTGRITYLMKSIEIAFITIITSSMRIRLKWEEKFREISNELQVESQTLKKSNGYNKIRMTIGFYLSLMPYYKKLLDYWENTKHELQNY